VVGNVGLVAAVDDEPDSAEVSWSSGAGPSCCVSSRSASANGGRGGGAGCSRPSGPCEKPNTVRRSLGSSRPVGMGFVPDRDRNSHEFCDSSLGVAEFVRIPAFWLCPELSRVLLQRSQRSGIRENSGLLVAPRILTSSATA